MPTTEPAQMKASHPDCMKCGAPIFQGVLCADCHSGIDTEPAQNQPTDWLNPDTRPQRLSWAPGNYSGLCSCCDKPFIGDKRAMLCAPCAYNDAGIAAAEARAVQLTLENASAATIHSCSDACQRPMCVLRRENKALTAKLALAERDSKEVRAAYKRLHSQIGGYLHGEQWDHWQAYNEPRYAPDAAMQPEGGL